MTACWRADWSFPRRCSKPAWSWAEKFMIALTLLIFGTVFGITMLAIAVGWRYLMVRRLPKVDTLKEGDAGAADQRPVVLVQKNERPSPLVQLAARFRLAERLGRFLEQSGLSWKPEALVARMAVGAALGGLAGIKLRVLIELVPSMVFLAL